MVVNKLSLLDLSEITNFLDLHRSVRGISRESEESLFHYVRNLIKFGGIVLTNKDRDIFLLIERKGSFVGVGHIYSAPEARGKKLVRFLRNCQVWGRENTELRYILNYTTDFKVKLLMQFVGAENIGVSHNQTVFRQVINKR